MKLKLDCANCGKNLFNKGVNGYYLLHNKSVELVCGCCFKYVFFNKDDFNRIKK